LQNDRLVIGGCLAALQHNNARSQAANERITAAFAELEQVGGQARGCCCVSGDGLRAGQAGR